MTNIDFTQVERALKSLRVSLQGFRPESVVEEHEYDLAQASVRVAYDRYGVVPVSVPAEPVPPEEPVRKEVKDSQELPTYVAPTRAGRVDTWTALIAKYILSPKCRELPARLKLMMLYAAAEYDRKLVPLGMICPIECEAKDVAAAIGLTEQSAMQAKTALSKSPHMTKPPRGHMFQFKDAAKYKI